MGKVSIDAVERRLQESDDSADFDMAIAYLWPVMQKSRELENPTHYQGVQELERERLLQEAEQWRKKAEDFLERHFNGALRRQVALQLLMGKSLGDIAKALRIRKRRLRTLVYQCRKRFKSLREHPDLQDLIRLRAKLERLRKLEQ